MTESDITVLVQSIERVHYTKVVYDYLTVNLENALATKVSPILIPLDMLELGLVTGVLKDVLRTSDGLSLVPNIEAVSQKFQAIFTALDTIKRLHV